MRVVTKMLKYNQSWDNRVTYHNSIWKETGTVTKNTWWQIGDIYDEE